jgi:hypothetical protein
MLVQAVRNYIQTTSSQQNSKHSLPQTRSASVVSASTPNDAFAPNSSGTLHFGKLRNFAQQKRGKKPIENKGFHLLIYTDKV